MAAPADSDPVNEAANKASKRADERELPFGVVQLGAQRLKLGAATGLALAHRRHRARSSPSETGGLDRP